MDYINPLQNRKIHSIIRRGQKLKSFCHYEDLGFALKLNKLDEIAINILQFIYNEKQCKMFQNKLTTRLENKLLKVHMIGLCCLLHLQKMYNL